MADSLHMALTEFRTTMLTAIATLEFKLRDQTQDNSNHMVTNQLVTTLNQIQERLTNLEKEKVNSCDVGVPQECIAKTFVYKADIMPESPKETAIAEEIMKIQATESQNVVVPIVKSSVPSVVSVQSVIEPGDEEAASKMDESEIEEGDPPSLEEFKYKGVTYYRDEDNDVFVRIVKPDMLEYEHVGVWDPNEEIVELFDQDDEESEEAEEAEEAEESEEAEEAEESEEAEEALECEPFEYRGKTYYRDEENNVYTEDGDQIGMWNGKRIIPVEVT